VPSAAQSLVELGAVPASVRTVNLCGEVLRNSLVRDLYGFENVDRVYNLYGPTEDTTYSTFTLCSRRSTQDPEIGVPLWNTRAYVLDSTLQLFPMGVEGDLYLSGAGIARDIGAAGSDGGALPGRSVWAAGRTHVPDRRLCPLACGWHARISGARRLSGKDSGIPRGTGRNRGCFERAARSGAAGGPLHGKTVPRANTSSLTSCLKMECRPISPHSGRRSRSVCPSIWFPRHSNSCPLSRGLPTESWIAGALPAPQRMGGAQFSGAAVASSGMEHVVASVWREVLKVERLGVHDISSTSAGIPARDDRPLAIAQESQSPDRHPRFVSGTRNWIRSRRFSNGSALYSLTPAWAWSLTPAWARSLAAWTIASKSRDKRFDSELPAAAEQKVAGRGDRARDRTAGRRAE